MDEQALQGQVALVTGAAGRIGSAIAQTLLRAGARVVVVDLDRSGAERVAHDLTKDRSRVAAMALDLTDERSVADAVQSSIDTFGRLDFLINNAGVNLHGEDLDAEATSAEVWIESPP